MLKINEIFHSIQGESTYAGERCVFIRLTGCNLRCTYCDTEYAFYDGTEMTIAEIIAKVKELDCSLVEVTGGEPLIQDETPELMTKLCDEGFEVMLETSGSKDISRLDERIKIILDIKTPSSKMNKKNLYENLNHLKVIDEIKFVIGSREDYDFAVQIVNEYDLTNKSFVLFSPVFDKIDAKSIVDWILEDKLDVRFQLQMHKFIWEPDTKGV